MDSNPLEVLEDKSWGLLDWLQDKGLPIADAFDKYNIPATVFPLTIIIALAVIGLLIMPSGTVGPSCGDGICSASEQGNCPADCASATVGKTTGKATLEINLKGTIESEIRVIVYDSKNSILRSSRTRKSPVKFVKIPAEIVKVKIKSKNGKVFESKSKQLKVGSNSIDLTIPPGFFEKSSSGAMPEVFGSLRVIVRSSSTQQPLTASVSVVNSYSDTYETVEEVAGEKIINLRANTNYYLVVRRQGFEMYDGAADVFYLPAGAEVQRTVLLNPLPTTKENPSSSSSATRVTNDDTSGTFKVCVRDQDGRDMKGENVVVYTVDRQEEKDGTTNEKGCVSFTLDSGIEVYASVPKPHSGCVLDRDSEEVRIMGDQTKKATLTLECGGASSAAGGGKSRVRVIVYDNKKQPITDQVTVTLWDGSSGARITGSGPGGSLAISSDLRYTETKELPDNYAVYALATSVPIGFSSARSPTVTTVAGQLTTIELTLPLDGNAKTESSPRFEFKDTTIPALILPGEQTYVHTKVFYNDGTSERELTDADNVVVKAIVAGKEYPGTYSSWVASFVAPPLSERYDVGLQAFYNGSVYSDSIGMWVGEFAPGTGGLMLEPLFQQDRIPPIDLRYKLTLEGEPVTPSQLIDNNVTIAFMADPDDPNNIIYTSAEPLRPASEPGVFTSVADIPFEGDYMAIINLTVAVVDELDAEESAGGNIVKLSELQNLTYGDIIVSLLYATDDASQMVDSATFSVRDVPLSTTEEFTLDVGDERTIDKYTIELLGGSTREPTEEEILQAATESGTITDLTPLQYSGYTIVLTGAQATESGDITDVTLNVTTSDGVTHQVTAGDSGSPTVGSIKIKFISGTETTDAATGGTSYEALLAIFDLSLIDIGSWTGGKVHEVDIQVRKTELYRGTYASEFHASEPADDLDFEVFLSDHILEPKEAFDVSADVNWRGTQLTGVNIFQASLAGEVSDLIWNPAIMIYRTTLMAPETEGVYSIQVYTVRQGYLRTEKVYVVDPNGEMSDVCPLTVGDDNCDDRREARRCTFDYLNRRSPISEAQLTACIEQAFPEGETYKIRCTDSKGDLDSDGGIDSDDIRLLETQILKIDDLAERNSAYARCADYDLDGDVDEDDLLCMKKVESGEYLGGLDGGVCHELDLTSCPIPGKITAGDTRTNEDIIALSQISDFLSEVGANPVEAFGPAKAFELINCADFNKDRNIDDTDVECLRDFVSPLASTDPIPEECFKIYNLKCEGNRGDLDSDGYLSDTDSYILQLIFNGRVGNLGSPGRDGIKSVVINGEQFIDCVDADNDGRFTIQDTKCLSAISTTATSDDEKRALCGGCLPDDREICGDGIDNDCDGLVDKTSEDESEDKCICNERTPCDMIKDGNTLPGISDGVFLLCRKTSWGAGSDYLGSTPGESGGYQWVDPGRISCEDPSDGCKWVMCNNRRFFCTSDGTRAGWFEEGVNMPTESHKHLCEDGWDNDCQGGDEKCRKFNVFVAILSAAASFYGGPWVALAMGVGGPALSDQYGDELGLGATIGGIAGWATGTEGIGIGDTWSDVSGSGWAKKTAVKGNLGRLGSVETTPIISSILPKSNTGEMNKRQPPKKTTTEPEDSGGDESDD